MYPRPFAAVDTMLCPYKFNSELKIFINQCVTVSTTKDLIANKRAEKLFVSMKALVSTLVAMTLDGLKKSQSFSVVVLESVLN